MRPAAINSLFSSFFILQLLILGFIFLLFTTWDNSNINKAYFNDNQRRTSQRRRWKIVSSGLGRVVIAVGRKKSSRLSKISFIYFNHCSLATIFNHFQQSMIIEMFNEWKKKKLHTKFVFGRENNENFEHQVYKWTNEQTNEFYLLGWLVGWTCLVLSILIDRVQIGSEFYSFSFLDRIYLLKGLGEKKCWARFILILILINIWWTIYCQFYWSNRDSSKEFPFVPFLPLPFIFFFFFFSFYPISLIEKLH